MLEERGYIPWRARLYSKKSAVILPEERGYIAQITRLYSRKNTVILLEECGYIDAMILMATSLGWRTHSARTKIDNFLMNSIYLESGTFFKKVTN